MIIVRSHINLNREGWLRFTPMSITPLIGMEDARFVLLFTPMSITPLIDMEDARFVLNVSRPSPKAILNGEIRYCLQLCCEQ